MARSWLKREEVIHPQPHMMRQKKGEEKYKIKPKEKGKEDKPEQHNKH